MASRTVTGIARYADGTLATSTTILWYQHTKPAVQDDALVLSTVRTTTTNASTAAFSVALEVPDDSALSFEYRVRMPDDMEYRFTLAQGDSITLHALLASQSGAVTGSSVTALLGSYATTAAVAQIKNQASSVANAALLSGTASGAGAGTLLVLQDGVRDGLFYWSATNPYADTTGGVAMAASNGFWLRIIDGYIHAKWFGLQGYWAVRPHERSDAAEADASSYATANVTALQNALDAAYALDAPNRRVVLDGLAYPVNGSIRHPHGVTVEGAGSQMTSIHALAGTYKAFTGLDGSTRLWYHNLDDDTDVAVSPDGHRNQPSFATRLRNLTLDGKDRVDVTLDMRSLNEGCDISFLKIRQGRHLCCYFGFNDQVSGGQPTHMAVISNLAVVASEHTVGIIFEMVRRCRVQQVTIDTASSLRCAIGVIFRGDATNTHYGQFHTEDVELPYLIEGGGPGGFFTNTLDGFNANFNYYQANSNTPPRSVETILDNLWNNTHVAGIKDTIFFYNDGSNSEYTSKPTWWDSTTNPETASSCIVFISNSDPNNVSYLLTNVYDGWVTGDPPDTSAVTGTITLTAEHSTGEVLATDVGHGLSDGDYINCTLEESYMPLGQVAEVDVQDADTFVIKESVFVTAEAASRTWTQYDTYKYVIYDQIADRGRRGQGSTHVTMWRSGVGTSGTRFTEGPDEVFPVNSGRPRRLPIVFRNNLTTSNDVLDARETGFFSINHGDSGLDIKGIIPHPDVLGVSEVQIVYVHGASSDADLPTLLHQDTSVPAKIRLRLAGEQDATLRNGDMWLFIYRGGDWLGSQLFHGPATVVNFSEHVNTEKGLQVGGAQVVGSAGAHIVDADGTLADITAKFNTLLSRLETHGLLSSS